MVGRVGSDCERILHTLPLGQGPEQRCASARPQRRGAALATLM